MTTVQQTYEQLRTQLQNMYDNRETAAIAAAVTAHITGLDNTGRLINKHKPLTQEQAELYNRITNELLLQKPLQYILHEAPFYGMNLYVDENVLIPRPETEELVDWIIREVKEEGTRYKTQEASKVQDTRYRVQEAREEHKTKNKEEDHGGKYSNSILDIGTGSGCIPIAIKKYLSFTDVHAIDISEKALAVAKKNAATQAANIHFYELDILNKNLWQQLPLFDVIVSNPPYITQKERSDMHSNVLQFEPHTALFVPDEHPLLFYETIASFGLQHLNNNGLLFFEINEVYGKEIAAMLQAKGYQNIQVKKDMQGKDRMVKAALLG